MGKFLEFFDSYLPATSLFSFHFRMITSKYQWIFTNLGMCIGIVEVWFGMIADGQISSNFCQSYLPVTCPFLDDNFI